MEVADSQGAAVHVRDSKTLTGPALTMERAAWAAFINFAGRHATEV
ncbi:DUF397 domain-containing protein [Streptomyces sp. NPDC057474]